MSMDNWVKVCEGMQLPDSREIMRVWWPVANKLYQVAASRMQKKLEPIH